MTEFDEAYKEAIKLIPEFEKFVKKYCKKNNVEELFVFNAIESFLREKK
jgi:hypothetical protein